MKLAYSVCITLMAMAMAKLANTTKFGLFPALHQIASAHQAGRVLYGCPVAWAVGRGAGGLTNANDT